MSIKPTRKSIDAFRDRLVEGVRIECIENTRTPVRVGAVATVTKPGKSRIGMSEPDRPGNPVLTFPARVSDVVALTDDSITYRSGRFGDLITWKVLAS